MAEIIWRRHLTLSSLYPFTRHCQVKPAIKGDPDEHDDASATENTDNSFPYVLVSSLLGTIVSLAAAFGWAVTTLGPVTGA